MVQVVCEALHEEEEVGAVGVVKAAMQLEDTELVTQEDTAEAMVAATDTAKDMDMTTTEVDMIRGQGQQYSGGKQRGAGRQAPRHQPY